MGSHWPSDITVTQRFPVAGSVHNLKLFASILTSKYALHPPRTSVVRSVHLYGLLTSVAARTFVRRLTGTHGAAAPGAGASRDQPDGAGA